MTPTIKSITLSDGTRLEDRGEVRTPKGGEWVLACANDREVKIVRAKFDHPVAYPILSPVEAPAGKIERRGDWSYAAGPFGGILSHGLNPLIDAACAVVNSMAYTDPVAESALAKLAAALEPFTQAVKEERFVVERRGDSFYVCDRDVDCGHIAKFDYYQDAKDFAAIETDDQT